jgi:hypothetical protein
LPGVSYRPFVQFVSHLQHKLDNLQLLAFLNPQSWVRISHFCFVAELKIEVSIGIGDTVKSMLGQDQQGTTETGTRASRRASRRLSEANADYDPNKTYDPDILNDPAHITNSNRASHRLPSGTGVGTSGRTAEGQAQQDLAREGASGYGTGDTVGGSLSSGARTSGKHRVLRVVVYAHEEIACRP